MVMAGIDQQQTVGEVVAGSFARAGLAAPGRRRDAWSARPAPAPSRPRPAPVDDVLAGILARSVSRRAIAASARPARRASRPTLARGKQSSHKHKKKKTTYRITKFKHRPFDPSDRPNFDKATYRHATIGHNLLRGATFDPNDPRLKLRNLAVPHRFSWKNLRDSTTWYLNHEESETDFRRWTDRMLVAGYQDKYEQYRSLRDDARRELQRLKNAGADDWDDDVLEQDAIIDNAGKLLRHLKGSNDRCVTARDDLTHAVERYHAAVADHRRAARQYDAAMKSRRHTTGKQYAALTKVVRAQRAGMNTAAKRANRIKDEVFSATSSFSTAINNHFANVSDLGPHDGVNNPVRDRMHLNVSPSGSMSPFSSRMLEMSPERVSGVAVDNRGWLVGTSGTFAKPSTIDPGLRQLFDDIGPSTANVKPVPFVFK